MKNYMKFWGTRGSCSVSGPMYAKYGGNTCCLEVRYGDAHIIMDAGTGIRPLGDVFLNHGIRKVDLFLSHTHWDHLIGFPFFEPLYETGVQITVHSPAGAGRSCRELFSDLLATEFFPVRLDQVQAHIDFRTTHQKTPVQIGDLVIDFHTTHHPGLTFCFKIKTPYQTIGYVTDNEMLQGFHGSLEELPPEISEPHLSLIEFLKDCDLLIHEAQYAPEEYLHKVGWGHSSVRNVAYIFQQTKIPHWMVTHHDPKHSDKEIDELAQKTHLILKEEKIDCKIEWIPDMHQIALK